MSDGGSRRSILAERNHVRADRLVSMKVALAYASGPLPTCESLMSRFECSRATAYRWIRDLADVRGVPYPASDRMIEMVARR